MITIKDIADRAGVSYATVSRALNNRSDVSSNTRKLIMDLAVEMGYQPNAIARSLVKRKSMNIALVVPDVSNPFFADITMAVNSAAEKAGYTTMVCNTGWDPQKEQEKLRIMVEQRVDGIILKPTGFFKPEILEAYNVPIIVLWHAGEDDLSYIEVDHEAGSRMAVKHLVDRGYKRIAYIGGQETSPANQIRLLAYQQTLQENGLKADPKLISFGGFSLESGYERFGQMTKLQQPPDAVFCSNDIIALGVLQYAREHEIPVPAKLGIIGFDDINYASLPQINLSTVSQPRDKLGEQALNALIHEMESFPERTRQRILVAPELKVRSTT
ncbi:MAG: LacI family DNA-binding transcriptional regulator [Eubacteriales bacterium]|nr:LacI family DNA-binding transcriptional regulator [Eubacteriales bacterium]